MRFLLYVLYADQRWRLHGSSAEHLQGTAIHLLATGIISGKPPKASDSLARAKQVTCRC